MERPGPWIKAFSMERPGPTEHKGVSKRKGLGLSFAINDRDFWPPVLRSRKSTAATKVHTGKVHARPTTTTPPANRNVQPVMQHRFSGKRTSKRERSTRGCRLAEVRCGGEGAARCTHSRHAHRMRVQAISFRSVSVRIRLHGNLPWPHPRKTRSLQV
eukprot:2611784-Pyramimonas_sp.AAC.1